MKKKVLILVGIIVAVAIVVIGENVCSASNKQTTNKEPIVNKQINSESTTDKQVNSNNLSKPKVLTQTQIAEKEKEAAKNWNLKLEKEKEEQKYADLNGAIKYISEKSANVLIQKYPNEKNNKQELTEKMEEILNKKITPEVARIKFNQGPKYDLNRFIVEIKPNNELGFGINIPTNALIAGTNKFVFITISFSKEN